MPVIELETGLARLSQSFASSKSSPEHLSNQYDLLEKGLYQAKNKKVISPLSAGEEVRDESRIRTIKDRLVNLGYLKTDPNNTQRNQSFRNAVIQFQKDAGISEDGWSGLQTWDAIQELVSFETPSNLFRWFDGDHPKPALKRATHLRLFVLGLCPTKPSDINVGKNHVFGGLNQFVKVSTMLDLSVDQLKPELCFETLSLLFDQDGLIAKLAKSKPMRSRDKRHEIHAFVMNVAKIELWMLGLKNITPNGHDSKDRNFANRSQSVDTNYYLKRSSDFYKAIRKYWEIHLEPDRSNTRAQQFLVDRFSLFFKQIYQDTLLSEGSHNEEVFTYFNDKSQKKKLNNAWNRVLNFGAKLWDGLKRVWNWIKNLARKVIDFATNIVRIGYDYIQRSFSFVTTSIEVVVKTVKFFMNKEIEGSDIRHALVQHDLDFDFISIVNLRANPERVSDLGVLLAHRASGFSLSSRILGMFIDLVKKAVKATFTGFLFLLIGLINLFRDAASIIVELDRWKQKEEELMKSSDLPQSA
ncbi:MAG: peptidoglycan-binding domain-containing protein [Mariprofundus sp.]|nr:peptidoglycan-binding domain-containing protein [Mariprofundus sp.]